MTRRLVVLGGGVTGLTAAWQAQRLGWEVTVVESSDRFGGKLRSSTFLGRQIDEGADAFLRRVPDALDLCDELGIDELVSPAETSASIWIDGQLKRLPSGLVLGAPARFDDLAASGILSPDGLRRARADAARTGPPLDHDEAAGTLIRQRYGDEVADRLVGPLLGGINAGDPDRLSIDAAVPQLAAAARSDASLSRALSALPPPSSEPVFAAPRNSMSYLPQRLVEVLADGGAQLLTSAAATGLERAGDEWLVSIDRVGEPSLDLDSRPTVLAADAVVIATPSSVAAQLVGERSPNAARILSGIDSSSVALVTLGYRSNDVGGPLDGSGFLVPRNAGLTLTAASWGSSKWPHWSDGDHVILRVSAGHRLDPSPLDLDDDDLVAALLRDLELTMGLQSDPIEIRVSRWMHGFPQYDVGHLDRMAELEAAVRADLPEVVICGAAHRGLGVPACIAQGRRAAHELHLESAA